MPGTYTKNDKKRTKPQSGKKIAQPKKSKAARKTGQRFI